MPARSIDAGSSWYGNSSCQPIGRRRGSRDRSQDLPWWPMDISRFDFELDEIVGLIPRLTGLAQIIELEPRLHQADEDKGVHSHRSDPTFRISCQMRGSEQTVSRLADLQVETGVEAVLDFGRSVRFRHSGTNQIAPPVAEERTSREPDGEYWGEEANSVVVTDRESEADSSLMIDEGSPVVSENDQW